MKHMVQTRAWIVAGILLIAAGCNGDIFLERNELPEYSEVSINGDGGQWSTTFSRKGLTKISLDCNYDDRKYVTYYSSKGITDADCPPSELESIVFENPARLHSIGFSGEMLHICSNYNALDTARATLHLEYDYGVTRDMYITISAGDPLQITMATPDRQMTIEEDFEQGFHRKSLVNNSNITQKLTIMPYLSSQCSDMVEPSEEWIDGHSIEKAVPAYDGKEWTLREFNNLTLARRRTFAPSRYATEEFSIDVPANKKATVEYVLHYSRATQKGNIWCYNAKSEQQIMVPFTAISIYATSYEYKVNYE